VASRASKMSVIGVVATAQGNTIGLEAHVVDSAKVGHHPYRVRTAMAGSAKLLRERIGIEHFWIKDIASALLPHAHGRDMLRSRPVAVLTGNAGNQSIKLQFIVNNGGCAVTTEAVARLIAGDVAAKGLLQTGRRIQRVADRPVQAIDARVITHATFIEFAIVTEHVSLRDLGIAKYIGDRLTDGFFSVGHAVDALLVVADDLIGVCSGAKGHPRMRSQHPAFRGRAQSVSHARLRRGFS